MGNSPARPSPQNAPSPALPATPAPGPAPGAQQPSRLDLALYGPFPPDAETALRGLTQEVLQRHALGSTDRPCAYTARAPLLVYRLCALTALVLAEEVAAGAEVPSHCALPVILVLLRGAR